MKKKLMLCFLAAAMIFSSVNAAALKIKTAQAAGGVSGVGVTLNDDGNSIQVTYPGQKEQEYAVLAMAEGAVTDGKPDMEAVRTANTDNPGSGVVYLNQQTAGADGTVEFNVYPLLDNADSSETYGIYISGSGANGAQLIGEFTLEEILRRLGDADGNGVVDGQDVSKCVDNFTKGIALTEEQKSALDVDNSGLLDGQDVSKIVDYFTKGIAMQ